ncbi:MAG TPA: uroporphyrinogen-III C-methyltransferase [Acidimicrobiales bacterium]|nr:uroporphyrinogen-III C-methyltransferase [Acidimicrobiales bacterium]
MTVFLVGAGPGDADLLTVRAARLLGEADVVVRDRLVDESVMGFVNPDARIVDVGKAPGDSSSQAAINALLVDLAPRYDTVVRLKGGDPFVFGRGGEELLALHQAGVACDVVPGLSSALAGPLAAGIPVTHRGVSRGVTIVSARGARGELTDFRCLANPELSLVILMGVERRRSIARELMEGGLHARTPVAVVEQAWTGQQRTTRGALEELADVDVRPPAIIVVGGVAALDLRSPQLVDVTLL